MCTTCTTATAQLLCLYIIFGIQGSGVAVRETLRPVGGKISPQIFLQQRWVPRSSHKLETESTIGIWHLENIIDEVESDWLELGFLSTACIGYIPFLEAPAGDLNFLCHFSS